MTALVSLLFIAIIPVDCKITKFFLTLVNVNPIFCKITNFCLVIYTLVSFDLTYILCFVIHVGSVAG